MFWVVNRRFGVIFGRFGVVWCVLGWFGVFWGVSTDPETGVDGLTVFYIILPYRENYKHLPLFLILLLIITLN